MNSKQAAAPPLAAPHGSASAMLRNLVSDTNDNGDYSLNIAGDDLRDFWRAVERTEQDLAHWKAVANYHRRTVLPEQADERLA